MSFLKFLASALFAVAMLQPGAAHAERLYTLWAIQPITEVLPTSAKIGEPFIEQKVLPARLVRLSADAVSAKGKKVPEGTLLYMVLNKYEQLGFCTVKNWTVENQAKTLFIPALDKRPCFTDSDGDGQFDKSFSVFDLPGGPPTARGSIKSAKPIEPVAFKEVDTERFPMDIRIMFALSGGDKLKKVRLNASMDWEGSGSWQEKRTVRSDKDQTIYALNLKIALKSIAGKTVAIDIDQTPDAHIYREQSGGISIGTLPEFAR